MQTYNRDPTVSAARRCELVADALELLLRQAQDTADTPPVPNYYDLQQAFELLEENTDVVGVDRLAQLEWSYLPALGHRPRTRTLHSLLARDPRFFVEVVSAIYRPSTDTQKDEPTPAQLTRAENAYRVLNSWHRVPGTVEAGGLDRPALQEWVGAAIDGLEQADRRSVGELHIGQVLSHAPADPRGQWPCAVVCELVEHLKSEDIERCIHTGRFNQRGITMRAPDAGGAPERALANEYARHADSCRDRWPRTAALLRSLSATYADMAAREDGSAERRAAGLHS